MTETHADQSVVAPASLSTVTLRPAVKALITCDDRVLLQKERHSDGEPFWTLPGGAIEASETAPQALRRELSEELQTRVVVGKQVGWFPYAHHGRCNTISVYTLRDCSMLEPVEPNPAEGVYESRWVTPRSLPAKTIPQIVWQLLQCDLLS